MNLSEFCETAQILMLVYIQDDKSRVKFLSVLTKSLQIEKTIKKYYEIYILLTLK